MPSDHQTIRCWPKPPRDIDFFRNSGKFQKQILQNWAHRRLSRQSLAGIFRNFKLLAFGLSATDRTYYTSVYVCSSTRSQCKRYFSTILMYCCTAHLPNYLFRMKLLAFLSISIFCLRRMEQFQHLPCPTRSTGAGECRHPCGALVHH